MSTTVGTCIQFSSFACSCPQRTCIFAVNLDVRKIRHMVEIAVDGEGATCYELEAFRCASAQVCSSLQCPLHSADTSVDLQPECLKDRRMTPNTQDSDGATCAMLQCNDVLTSASCIP